MGSDDPTPTTPPDDPMRSAPSMPDLESGALQMLRARIGHTVRIEVEVDTLNQLEETLRFPIDAVLLDNMDVSTLKKAVALVKGRVATEASGGVTLENVGEIAKTGVDLISVGALTHSARSLDSSLEWTG